MTKWKKIKTIKGKMWHTNCYETSDKKAKYTYKIVSTPTAVCKREWKRIGDTARKTIKYSNTKP